MLSLEYGTTIFGIKKLYCILHLKRRELQSAGHGWPESVAHGFAVWEKSDLLELQKGVKHLVCQRCVWLVPLVLVDRHHQSLLLLVG